MVDRRRARFIFLRQLRGRPGGYCGQLRSVLEPFWFHVLEQAFASTFASVATLAISAEATGGIEEICTIHPSDTRFQLRRDLQCDTNVLTPDARGESIYRVIRKFDGLLWCAECHSREHRAENLLLRDNRRGMDVTQDRWRKPEAARGQGDLWLPAGCALRHSLCDHALNSFQLNSSHNGSDVDRFIKRRADAQGVHAIADFRNQHFRDAF